MAEVLRVALNGTPVGELRQFASGRIEFRLAESYRTSYPRPVLGQAFEDSPDWVWRSHTRLPPFFSNLLPEGALRELVAAHLGVRAVREFHVLAHLGDDLPGAVTAVSEGTIFLDRDEPAADPHDRTEEGIGFSLAGVQLKFSMVRQGNVLTLPMKGQSGSWIVKLPDPNHASVPDNEFTTMSWARMAGIDVPDFELVPVESLEGIPAGDYVEPRAFAIRRFDRAPSGQRVHQEDFAQVLGLYPEEKYRKHNYETIGRILLEVAGEESYLRFVDRLIFVVLSGNADAHHKNWSLRYADGRTATLSPAYDLVSTVPYGYDRLGLNLCRSKEFSVVSAAAMQRFGRRVGANPDLTADRAREAAHRVVASWSAARAASGLVPAVLDLIERHMNSVPIAAESAA